MQFYQSMLQETIELLKGDQLPYDDSILIGDNASGKSEALKQFMKQTDRVLYFIDAINRNFNVRAVKPIGEELQYTETILKKRLEDENFNLKDTWSYYGTATECIELIYPIFEEKLQQLFFELFETSFSIFSPETQEIRFDSGDAGKLSNGHQAVVRILLELLYFQKVNPIQDGEQHALVVIDELDEYLSPRNTGKFYDFITKTFPEMDFIVTTHSAEVVAAAVDCNIIIMHEKNVEILDAGDFSNIDDAMTVFKSIFGGEIGHSESKYEEILRKLFNNRIAGVWGENEIKCYEAIQLEQLTKAEQVLYRQIGAW